MYYYYYYNNNNNKRSRPITSVLSDTPVLALLCGPDLRRGSSGGGVSDGPGCLLPGPELRLLQDVDEHREDVGVDHSLRWDGQQKIIFFLDLCSFLYFLKSAFQTITTAVDPGLQLHTWDPVRTTRTPNTTIHKTRVPGMMGNAKR